MNKRQRRKNLKKLGLKCGQGIVVRNGVRIGLLFYPEFHVYENGDIVDIERYEQYGSILCYRVSDGLEQSLRREHLKIY